MHFLVCFFFSLILTETFFGWKIGDVNHKPTFSLLDIPVKTEKIYSMVHKLEVKFSFKS